jgi:hypothetical protein
VRGQQQRKRAEDGSGSNEEEGRGARETSRLESREEKQAHMQVSESCLRGGPCRPALPLAAALAIAGRSLHWSLDAWTSGPASNVASPSSQLPSQSGNVSFPPFPFSVPSVLPPFLPVLQQ